MEKAWGEAFHRSCLHPSRQKCQELSLCYQKGKPKPKSELSEEETPRDETHVFILWASVGSQHQAGLAKDTEQNLSSGAMPCEKEPGHQVSAPRARGAGRRDPGDHTRLGDTGTSERGDTPRNQHLSRSGRQGGCFLFNQNKGWVSFLHPNTQRLQELPESVPLES